LANLLYDSDMLDDLDHLSTRVAKLVALTQQLAADQKSLQSQLTQVQAERDALKAKLDLEGSEAKALHKKVDTFASERASLQGSLDLFKQEHTSLQAQLQSRDLEVNTLREATVQARQRIEAVLERLPGAPQPEEPR